MEANGRWWLVDCFGDGLEDISPDVVFSLLVRFRWLERCWIAVSEL